MPPKGAVVGVAAAANEHPFIRGVSFLGTSIELRSGDITTIHLSTIVNASNTALRGGGGINRVIQTSAGPGLLAELALLYPNGGATGMCYPTGSHNIASCGRIYHVPGPDFRKYTTAAQKALAAVELRNAYWNSLALLWQENFSSIAFPTISTGTLKYPRNEAARIALTAAREFIEELDADGERGAITRIVFLVFGPPGGPDEVALNAAWDEVFPIDESPLPSSISASPEGSLPPLEIPPENSPGGSESIPSEAGSSSPEPDLPKPSEHSSSVVAEIVISSPSEHSTENSPGPSPEPELDPNERLQCTGTTRQNVQCRNLVKRADGPGCHLHRE